MSATIIKYANEFTQNVVSRQPSLRAKKFELERQLEEVKADLHFVDTAIDRLSRFQAEVRGNFQCPRCWIEDEVATDLVAVPNDDDREDILRCHTCHLDFSISVK